MQIFHRNSDNFHFSYLNEKWSELMGEKKSVSDPSSKPINKLIHCKWMRLLRPIRLQCSVCSVTTIPLVLANREQMNERTKNTIPMLMQIYMMWCDSISFQYLGLSISICKFNLLQAWDTFLIKTWIRIYFFHHHHHHHLIWMKILFRCCSMGAFNSVRKKHTQQRKQHSVWYTISMPMKRSFYNGRNAISTIVRYKHWMKVGKLCGL